MIEILRAIRMYRKVKSMYKLIINENLRTPVLEDKFQIKYDLDKTELLASFVQYFYERGISDTVKNKT